MTYGITYKPTTHSVTTTAAEALPVNSARRGLVLFNTGSVDVQFAIDNVGYIPIVAGAHIALPELAPGNAVYLKTASGTGTVVSWER